MKLLSEKGAAVVEFAVILPLLLLIVFGIIEFGFLIYNKAMITNASREGARIGIVYLLDRTATDLALPDGTTGTLNDLIDQTVDGYLSNYLISFGGAGSHSTTTNPASAGTITQGDYLDVTVTYHYNFLVIPSFITDLTGGVDLVGTTTMRAE